MIRNNHDFRLLVIQDVEKRDECSSNSCALAMLIHRLPTWRTFAQNPRG
jgi:hypothetical protein